MKQYTIGDYSYKLPKIITFGEDAFLNIGKFCSIAGEVKVILCADHRIDWISTFPFNKKPKYFPEALDIEGHPTTKGDVNIGNDVWIGWGATILSGITIGDGAVIGACSVVSKDVAPYTVVAGNPIKVIRKRFDDDKIKELLELEWWNWPIEKIKNNVHVLCSKNFGDLCIDMK